MAVNKVVYNGNTLIDLTDDTVTPDTLVKGMTSHDAAGNPITGTYDGVTRTELNDVVEALNKAIGDKADKSSLDDLVSQDEVNALEARLSALENSVVAVLSGTEEPTSDIGEDGDIYLVTE